MPIDLSVIFPAINATIIKTDELPDVILGSARLSNCDKWIIIVNKHQILSRQRFTIAHEIGHIVLHHKHTEYYLAAARNTWQERQANVFASELLMPVGEFKNLYFNQHITDAVELSRYFQVSTQAASIRIDEIARPPA